MWLFPTKKEIKESFKKLKSHITELTSQSLNNRVLIEKNQDSIQSQNEKIARLEGMVSVMLQGKSQSQSLPVSMSVSKSQSVPNNFETKLVRKVKRNKKALIMQEISKLQQTHSTIDIFEAIVTEKGLCSKASFYRYIASLKSQGAIEVKSKLRQN